MSKGQSFENTTGNTKMTDTKTQETESEYIGWDEPYESAGSQYLKLAAKGDMVRIRIIGTPLRFLKTYKDKETGQEETSWKRAAKVIYRNPDTKKDEVRGFEFGPQIGRSIQDFFKDEDWGNPEGYDLVITRAEEPGNFYKVMPKGKSPLTQGEKDLILESDIDLQKMYVKDPFAD